MPLHVFYNYSGTKSSDSVDSGLAVEGLTKRVKRLYENGITHPKSRCFPVRTADELTT
jgi:hypothetical protein